ncbi:hypothetical protein [Mesorhizobium sp. CN2-181]|uniref:hypothetical protein n=1 Tax=Mesorhizobium yinganensis TaxID=3157707 RepID=UPI0032B7E0C7
MKAELDRSKASFKLDLIETANADPMLSPADFKLLVAYVSVMEWPSCRTWLASTLAQAMTGLSERQFRSSRACLRGQNDAGRAYLSTARQSGKIVAYRLANPWRDQARAHVPAMVGYHKEVERQKKAATRNRASRQNLPGHEPDLSRQNLQGQNDDGPGKICRSVPAQFAAYSPSMITPKKKDARHDENGAFSLVTNDNKRKIA